MVLTLLLACHSSDSEVLRDTDVVDTHPSGDTDTPTIADTDRDSDSDTDAAQDTDVEPVPDRLATRRWRLTFEDDFDGGDPGDPCYDPSQTPPMCLDRYWSRAPCSADDAARMQGLNFCAWSAYDIYNWMDWGKPLGTGIDNLDPQEVSVHDGSLWLNASKLVGDGVYDCGNDVPNYYVTNDCPIRSGAIMSRPWDQTAGFAQAYGRFEIDAILPRGGGAWPAHWMLPVDGGWPEAGELDVLEAVAGEPTVAQGNFHGGTYDGSTRIHQGYFNSHDPGDERFLDEVHTYAVEWAPDEVRWFVDDLEIGHLDQGDPVAGDVLSSPGGAYDGAAVDPFPVTLPNTPFYFVLNTSVVPTGAFDLDNFAGLVHRIDAVRAFVGCDPGDGTCDPRGSGTADVTTHAWMSGPKWSTGYRVMHRGDFDGDGADDVLLRTAFADHATYLLRGDGRGGFLHEDTLTDCCWMNASLWSNEYRDGLVGDFDGDGDDDLLLQGRRSPHATYLMVADGAGSFANQLVATDLWGMSYDRWSADVRHGYVGDFDGNGSDDLLLVGVSASDESVLLLADGAGGFVSSTVTAASGDVLAGSEVIVADFDGDGASDVLLRGPTEAAPTWLLRGGATGLTGADVTGSFGMDAQDWSGEWRAAATGDFDADGKADLLLQGRGWTDRTLLLFGDTAGFRNASNFTFVGGMNWTTWSANSRIARVGDFDGDGADDVLLQATGSALTTLLLTADRQGGFLAVRDVTEDHVFGPSQWADAPRELTVGDWDGDGADDLLLRGRADDEKSYLVYEP